MCICVLYIYIYRLQAGIKTLEKNSSDTIPKQDGFRDWVQAHQVVGSVPIPRDMTTSHGQEDKSLGMDTCGARRPYRVSGISPTGGCLKISDP